MLGLSRSRALALLHSRAQRQTRAAASTRSVDLIVATRAGSSSVNDCEQPLDAGFLSSTGHFKKVEVDVVQLNRFATQMRWAVLVIIEALDWHAYSHHTLAYSHHTMAKDVVWLKEASVNNTQDVLWLKEAFLNNKQLLTQLLAHRPWWK
ncbi:hypothetical protein T492DRAFT_835873 [Pavlovales sp. CCMP2436]|nr:hypothetical protein T492DRAFT_835873 [Pavlovales sp. CCMP2436]